MIAGFVISCGAPSYVTSVSGDRDPTEEEASNTDVRSAQPGDLDNDGVPDVDDRCPCHAEDRDGFADGDGCPDPDNDQDHIPDICDHCPNEPEPFNGHEDDDGCRDSEQRVGDDRVELRILETVRFGRNEATMPAEQISVVDQIAAALVANAEIRIVEIQGHASRGERRPQRLGEQRAQTVIAALVERGIEMSRLRSRSLAASQPRHPTDHETNQRVEFFVVEQERVHRAPAPFEPPCEAPWVESACPDRDRVNASSKERVPQ